MDKQQRGPKHFNVIEMIVIVALTIAVIPTYSFALPILQTYIPGSTAGSSGQDEETWFNTGSSTFGLYVVGAYGPKMNSLTGVTLLVSVPEGERGTISFSTADETPVLLTTIGQGSASLTNPTRNANLSILTNVSGNTGYSTINNNTFLPTGLNLNNHYPLKDEVSDFLIFDLGSFDNVESNLNDYNASTGTITQTNQSGEQKEYLVTVNGFTWAHFDAYGLANYQKGKRRTELVWENNPGSHDSTTQQVVPEPSTLLLLGSGFLGLGLYRKRSKP